MARKSLSSAALAAAAGLAGDRRRAARLRAGSASPTGVDAGELDVPVNKSQVLRTDRPYAKALIGNPDIADILPLDRPLGLCARQEDRHDQPDALRPRNRLIAVVDVVVGPDVITLKRQLSELMPGDDISARMSNDSVILEGTVSSAVAADRAVQIAETYAPGKVVNLLSLGSAQQVMLEVRFAEVKRSALKQIGVNWDSAATTASLQRRRSAAARA